MSHATIEIDEIVKESGSSFYWAMRFLPPEKRAVMYAIYAFCRKIDDIADEPAPLNEKLEGLKNWREDINAIADGKRPEHPIARFLTIPIREFDLPPEEFIALIDGMAMDVPDPLQAPSVEDMILYCRRVAGAVGVLSLRVFGCTGEIANRLAVAQGEALQITNILRDMEEDAEMGRLYLPREMIEGAGISVTTPEEILAHPDIGKARVALAKIAADRFAESKDLLKQLDKKQTRPARIMLLVYEAVYKAMEKRGFEQISPRVSLSPLTKLLCAFKGMLT